jgi:hypothetical protein
MHQRLFVLYYFLLGVVGGGKAKVGGASADGVGGSGWRAGALKGCVDGLKVIKLKAAV